MSSHDPGQTAAASQWLDRRLAHTPALRSALASPIEQPAPAAWPNAPTVTAAARPPPVRAAPPLLPAAAADDADEKSWWPPASESKAARPPPQQRPAPVPQAWPQQAPAAAAAAAPAEGSWWPPAPPPAAATAPPPAQRPTTTTVATSQHAPSWLDASNDDADADWPSEREAARMWSPHPAEAAAAAAAAGGASSSGSATGDARPRLPARPAPSADGAFGAQYVATPVHARLFRDGTRRHRVSVQNDGILAEREQRLDDEAEHAMAQRQVTCTNADREAFVGRLYAQERSRKALFQRQRDAKAKKENVEEARHTFKPRINRLSEQMAAEQHGSKSQRAFFERLYTERKTWETSYEKTRTTEHVMQRRGSMPTIFTRSPKKQKAINARRKKKGRDNAVFSKLFDDAREQQLRDVLRAESAERTIKEATRVTAAASFAAKDKDRRAKRVARTRQRDGLAPAEGPGADAPEAVSTSRSLMLYADADAREHRRFDALEDQQDAMLADMNVGHHINSKSHRIAETLPKTSSERLNDNHTANREEMLLQLPATAIDPELTFRPQLGPSHAVTERLARRAHQRQEAEAAEDGSVDGTNHSGSGSGASQSRTHHLHAEGARRAEKLKRLKEAQEDQEAAECTFEPHLWHHRRGSKVSVAEGEDGPMAVEDRLHEWLVNRDVKRLKQQRDLAEEAEHEDAYAGPQRRGTMARLQAKGRRGTMFHGGDKEKKIMVEMVRSRLQAMSYSSKGQDFERMLRQLDRDKSGTLDFHEFKSALRRCLRITPAKMSDEDILEMFEAIDLDMSEEVTIQEVTKFFKPKTHTMRVKRDRGRQSWYPSPGKTESALRAAAEQELSLQQMQSIRARLRAKAYGLGGVSEDSVLRLVKRFAIDVDGHGHYEFDRAALRAALRKGAHLSEAELPEEQLGNFFLVLDDSGDGMVEMSELVAFIMSDEIANLNAQLAGAESDADDDGASSAAASSAAPPAAALSRDDMAAVRDVFEAADRNGSGSVSVFPWIDRSLRALKDTEAFAKALGFAFPLARTHRQEHEVRDLFMRVFRETACDDDTMMDVQELRAFATRVREVNEGAGGRSPGRSESRSLAELVEADAGAVAGEPEPAAEAVEVVTADEPEPAAAAAAEEAPVSDGAE